MTRRVSAKTQALADQIIAILRDADGFPISTGEIASQLGGRWRAWQHHDPAKQPRPPCWTDDVVDEGLTGQAWCQKCDGFHRPPVWRNLDAQDIRGLLNRLARDGEIEKVAFSDNRVHYWRRDDTDTEAAS